MLPKSAWGQTEKVSLRANVVCFTSASDRSGHRSTSHEYQEATYVVQ
jgi:hypothetical protein